MSILKRIETLRENNGGISINRLEKEAGLSRGSVAKWDDHPPSYEKAKKAADYFGVSVEFLLTGEEQKKPAQANVGELSGRKKAITDYVASPDAEKKIIDLMWNVLDTMGHGGEG